MKKDNEIFRYESVITADRIPNILTSINESELDGIEPTDQICSLAVILYLKCHPGTELYEDITSDCSADFYRKTGKDNTRASFKLIFSFDFQPMDNEGDVLKLSDFFDLDKIR